MSSTSRLKSAISSKTNETVSNLLEKMDIEAVNRKEKGETALHVACYEENQVALDSLLAMAGIDVNIDEDNTGWTPLHIAICFCNLQAIAKLLDRPEIDVNAKSIDGSTPLHWACRRNLPSIARKLLSSPGIDVNATDYYGDPPIMDSARLCNKDAFNVMLDDPRVNLDIKNKKGRRLEEKVGVSGSYKEETDKCLEMIRNERMRRENGKIGQEQTNQAGSIGRGILRVERINKEIVMEQEKNNKNVDMRKQKMENLVTKQTFDKKILAKKYKEKLSLLEKNQKHEITALRDTFARDDHNEQRYIASLIEHRDELAQELENAGNDASSHERSKLEPITRSLECPVCMELMRPPTKIWMCRFTHVICEVCKDLLKAEGGNCPTCTTEPFTGRNYMAEDLARTVFNE